MILCLDYGDRYVGVAATDSDERVPYRHGTIDQTSQDAVEAVRNIVRREKVAEVIVGVPINFKREETEQTRKTMAFIRKLRDSLGGNVRVKGIDEMFTSREARRTIREEGAGRESEHAEAARLMLADYLNRI